MFLHLSVSHSVHGSVMMSLPSMDSTPSPGQHTHPRQHHPPDQQAGGMNPTGMLSCLSTRTLQVLQLHKSKNSNAESSCQHVKTVVSSHTNGAIAHTNEYIFISSHPSFSPISFLYVVFHKRNRPLCTHYRQLERK